MTKIKALHVLQHRDYLRELYGESALEAIRRAMDPVAREHVYSEALIASDWLEVAYAVEHSVTSDRVLGKGDGSFATGILRELARRQLTSLYRSILTDTPRALLERSSRLWLRYYDRGETKVEMIAENHAIKHLYGCADMPAHHDWLTTPYFEELVRFAGAQDPSALHTRCVARGDDHCETEIRWK